MRAGAAAPARVEAIDGARGMALLAMIAYHLAFDLRYFGVTQSDFEHDPFWLGARMNLWAEDWVSYWTRGEGRFATTAEEDAGFMQSLTFLSQVHKVDLNRVLVLLAKFTF